MKINILCFGITREIVGCFEYAILLNKNDTVAILKQKLISLYPDFEKLKSLRIAVNSEYVTETTILKIGDEVVLIPPVSGG